MAVERAVTARGFHCAYRHGPSDVIEGLDLEVGQGEIVGLAGPSGCGKTTLLHAICGLIPHSLEARLAGQLDVFGKSVRSQSIQEMARQVQIVHQRPGATFLAATVEEELSLGMRNFGFPEDEIRVEVANMMAHVGLSGLADRYPHSLSSGEKQRLSLGAALLLRPRLLLLDEPTANLDPPSTAAFVELVLRARAARGLTVLLAEHDLDLMHELCDRVVEMGEGLPNMLAVTGMHQSWGDNGRWSMVDGRRCSDRGGLINPAVMPCALTGDHECKRQEAECKVQTGQGSWLSATIDHRPSTITYDRRSSRSSLVSVRLSLDGQPILDEVSLEIRPGEVVALVGPNGAGKTTLARVLCGLARGFSGSCTVAGLDPRRAGLHELARHAGYVSQDPLLQLFAPTCLAEAAFRGRNLGAAAPEEAGARLLAAAGLMGYADVHPMELSVGEQRRLTCISQMVSPPDLLVVDEPTTGLDAVACDRILALLAEHAASGGAVLIITHDLRAARRVAGRIVALRAGRIVEDRPTEEFFSDPTALERAGLQRQGGSKPTPSGGDDV